MGVDATQSLGGFPSAYVRSTAEVGNDAFGGMAQTISVEQFRGRRVQLSGWVKTEELSHGGHLWMRVDGKDDKELQFDNMGGRAPKGTTEWERYTVVLDVPEEASRLNYGFFVTGSGRMWVNGLTVEPVGAEVASTNIEDKPRELPKAPENLGFSPK